MTRQEQKAAAFRALHAAEPFVIPNPWDPGSARMLNFHAPGAPYVGRGDTYDPPADGGKGDGVVAPPDEGERLIGKERVAYIKASLPELTLSVFELEPRFEGPDPHRHDDHVDSFYVLDGDIEFQLGGSDSDPPTLLPILNQREFALRGYTSGNPDLTGHRARIGTLEWRVPLKDVDRHAMVPPLGLNRMAMNLLFDVGDAWPRGAEPDYRRGVGIELMSEVRFGYLLGADLRLGLAKGLDERGKTTAYLRAGRSF